MGPSLQPQPLPLPQAPASGSAPSTKWSMGFCENASQVVAPASLGRRSSQVGPLSTPCLKPQDGSQRQAIGLRDSLLRLPSVLWLDGLMRLPRQNREGQAGRAPSVD